MLKKGYQSGRDIKQQESRKSTGTGIRSGMLSGIRGLVCGLVLWGGGESMSALDFPGAVVQEEATASESTAGRLEGAHGILIQEGGQEWKWTAENTTDFTLQFWMRPVKWDAFDDSSVRLLKVWIGDVELSLDKVKDESLLALRKNQGGESAETPVDLQVYPIYAWDEKSWAKGLSKKKIFLRSVGWHHVMLTVHEGELQLTVDGFAARVVGDKKITGALQRVRLEGGPGTAFDEISVLGGGTLESDVLRQRYLAQMLSLPKVEQNTLTAAYMVRAPEADGVLKEGEWTEATRLSNWVGTGNGVMLPAGVEGYLGYDDTHLYLALVQSEGEENEATAEEEKWDIFIGPPFVSGERPRRLIRLHGMLSGEQVSEEVLPVANKDWTGKWNWVVGKHDGKIVAEFSARFEDLELPAPVGDQTWTLNLLNTVMKTAWSRPAGGDTNVESMGVLQFDKNAPVIRVGNWQVDAEKLVIPVEAVSGDQPRRLQVGLHYFASGAIEPTEVVEKVHGLPVGRKWQTQLILPFQDKAESGSGRVAVYVKEGDTLLFYQSGELPTQK